MSNWERVEQLLGAENLSRLAGVHVGIVGLGSGGGFVAQSLAMSGVGHFTLVDDDVLDDTNVVRHVAGLTEVGTPKVDAVATLIYDRNPQATVEARNGQIEQHMDVLDAVDLLIVGVDQEQVKYVINEACLSRKLTAVYAGVFERGEGGDVVIIRPGVQNEPCYACWAAELREGLAVAEMDASEELDYGMIGESGTLEAEPGLWLHVVRVAATQADIALNELLAGSTIHEPMPGNTVIMANRHLEIIEGATTPPYSAVWVTIHRDPDCLVCGERAQNRLKDSDTADNVSLDDLMGATGMTLEDQDE